MENNDAAIARNVEELKVPIRIGEYGSAGLGLLPRKPCVHRKVRASDITSAVSIASLGVLGLIFVAHAVYQVSFARDLSLQDAFTLSPKQRPATPPYTHTQVRTVYTDQPTHRHTLTNSQNRTPQGDHELERVRRPLRHVHKHYVTPLLPESLKVSEYSQVREIRTGLLMNKSANVYIWRHADTRACTHTERQTDTPLPSPRPPRTHARTALGIQRHSATLLKRTKLKRLAFRPLRHRA